MPETKQLVARNALVKLFSGSYFDICTVRALCAVAEVGENSPAFRLLQSLHCMHYRDMDPALRDRLPHLVNEALQPPPRCVAADVALQGVTFQ